MENKPLERTRIYMEYKPLESHRPGSSAGAQKRTTYGTVKIMGTKAEIQSCRRHLGKQSQTHCLVVW